MIATFPAHYVWWILALLLIAAEVLAPGYFMLWVGIAAAATGAALWLLPSLGVLPQALLFSALAFLSCGLYWRLLRPRFAREDADAGTLNRRGEAMIGRRVVLGEAIVNGRGRALVGDGMWLAEGPDLPSGTEVEVTAVDGTTLKVRAVAER